MEKNKGGISWEKEISGYHDCFPFTHEQAFRIKDILILNFPAEQVRRFIDEVRNDCDAAVTLLSEPGYKEYKNDRKSMVATLKKCDSLLDDLQQGKGLKHLSSFSALEEYQEIDFLEIQEIAHTTSILLSILLRKIKSLDDTNIKRKRGRPTADDKEIVTRIAKIWEECFNQKVTTYDDSLFIKVLQIILEGLNLEYEYPQRKIRDAVGRLKDTK